MAEALANGVPRISRDASADFEDERVLIAAFAELAAEASEIERCAIDLDRAGDPEQAVAVYRQVAERLAKAAAACPEGNPDRAVLARHAGEVLGRVVYLESLNGAPASVPPEGHIGCDRLVIPGPGVERQVSDGFQLIASPTSSSRESSWAKKAASAAAVSGAAGLLVLHAPVCAVGLAAGAAYATTREDSAGEAARSMGSMGLQAAAHVRHVAREHRLSERLDGALSGVRSFDERWRVSERTQAAAVSSAVALRDLDERHQVSSTVAKGAIRAGQGAGSLLGPAASWVARRFSRS